MNTTVSPDGWIGTLRDGTWVWTRTDATIQESRDVTRWVNHYETWQDRGDGVRVPCEPLETAWLNPMVPPTETVKVSETDDEIVYRTQEPTHWRYRGRGRAPLPSVGPYPQDEGSIHVEHPLLEGVSITFHNADRETAENLGLFKDDPVFDPESVPFISDVVIPRKGRPYFLMPDHGWGNRPITFDAYGNPETGEITRVEFVPMRPDDV